MLIDTHTHVTFHEFKGESEEVVSRALEQEIWLVNIGTKLETSQAAIELAEKFEEGVYASIGIHPIHLIADITESASFEGHQSSFTTKKQTFNYDEFKKLAQSSSKVVAIGETGLDYYRLGDKNLEEVRKVQTEVFRQSIRLAKELNLALVVHGRGEADKPYAVYDEIIQIIKEEKISRGSFHCFGGTLEQAREIVELGFNIGVTGIVTFKNAQVLQTIVKSIPLENIVIETDAPYLAPDPYRGKRNEPSYVSYVAAKIAELREIPLEKVMEETTVNARRMYII